MKKIDWKYSIKKFLQGKKYPVNVITLQQLGGKTYMIQEDKERRKVDKDGGEHMKSLKEGKLLPPVDYSMYVANKQGVKHLIALETDAGERYPLTPLTYGDIFAYDRNGEIIMEGDQPVMRTDFLKEVRIKKQDGVIGLKALSKGRRQYFLQQMEKAILKHPFEVDNAGRAMAAVTVIFIVIAIIIFFQGMPGVAEAGNALKGAAP